MKLQIKPLIFTLLVLTSSVLAQSQLNPVFRSKDAVQPILRLQISNGTNVDEAILYANPGASNAYDAYDSPKMFNASASLPEIYTTAGSEQLAINGLNTITYDTEYPLGVLILNASVATYSIKATQFSNFPAGTKILLKDKLNVNSPVTTDLTNLTDSYSFSTGALNYNTSRFAVVIKSPDPSITVSGSLSAVHTSYGAASSSPASFKVSGTYLTANIILTAPTGFELSKTGISGAYAASQTLTQSGGVVAETSIYVRLASGNASGSYAGNISCASTGAASVNVATVSSNVSPVALSISGLSGESKAYDGTNTASFTGTPAYTGLVNGENFTVSGTPVATFDDASVGNSKVITVNGFVAPSANYTLTAPTLTAAITPLTQTINTSGSIGNSSLLPGTDLTVSAGVRLDVDNDATVRSITVNPGGQVTLKAAKTLNTVTFTLQSNAGGTATLLDNGGTLNASVSNVQQYLGAGRNWYISSPVSNATTAVFAPDAQHPVYSYDEIHGTDAPWVSTTDASTALSVMKGYVFRPATDGVISFSGTINTGSKSITLTRTAGQTKEGFNLIGNPYPSYLDWNQLTKTNVSSTLWYRTKTAADAYTFDTYNSSGHVGTSNGVRKVTNLIPPMQAFWVRVSDGQSSGTIAVDNSMRAGADDPTNLFKAPSQNLMLQPELHIQLSDGINSDETILYSASNASDGFDDFDSPKIAVESTGIAEIYSMLGSEQLVINGFNTIPYDTEIPLGFTTSRAGTFSIRASQISNFEPGTQVLLKDYADAANPLGFDLSNAAGYSFTAGISPANTGRFSLIFKAPSVATAVSKIDNKDFCVLADNGRIKVCGQADQTITISNSQGLQLSSFCLNSNAAYSPKLPPGIYLVTLSGTNTRLSSKVLIK